MKNLNYKIQRGLQNYWQLYARNQTPIAIFCTGRVGSMAMFYTLEELGFFTFKIEHLANEKQRRIFGNSKWFYEHVIEKKRPAKIVSVARDPMALMVSDFFNKLHWISGKENAWDVYSIAELQDLFNQAYFEQGRHYEHLKWWDFEFKAALGIDVYQQASPRDEGWTRFQDGQYDVLLLRTELDDTTKSAALGEFIGQSNLQLKRRNVGDEKIFGKVYKQFKAEVCVAPQHLDYVYASPYSQHFYNEQEIAAFRASWSNNANPIGVGS